MKKLIFVAISDRLLRQLKGLGCFWNTFGGEKGVAGTEKDSLFVLTNENGWKSLKPAKKH